MASPERKSREGPRCRPDSQNEMMLVGAIAADSKDAEAAKTFIAHLKTPDVVAVFKAKGVSPRLRPRVDSGLSDPATLQTPGA